MPGNDNLLQRITVHPGLLDGRPCIRGSRVTVESVLDRLAQGASPEAILTDHPGLELDDVFACAAYARAIVAGDRRDTSPATKASETIDRASPTSASESPTRISLRDLATRPSEEIDRAVQAAQIVMDADEIGAWDGEGYSPGSGTPSCASSQRLRSRPEP